jgi:RNA polymerase sigma-70 factor (ECF subfamily)
MAGQQRAVDAFLAAARTGDLEALVAILDPEVVVRADWGKMPTRVPTVLRGARPVAHQALAFARRAPYGRPALVNGAAGVVVAAGTRLIAVMGFTVRGDKITEIDILADPERLRHLDLTALGNRPG